MHGHLSRGRSADTARLRISVVQHPSRTESIQASHKRNDMEPHDSESRQDDGVTWPKVNERSTNPGSAVLECCTPSARVNMHDSPQFKLAPGPLQDVLACAASVGKGLES